MRRHFHRCANLRVVSIDASELSGNRRGGGPILDELCEAKGLTPCLGLVECDVLAASQKQNLLVSRATRLRELEGVPTPLAGARAEVRIPDEIQLVLPDLRRQLLRERGDIVAENQRMEVEVAAALEFWGSARASEEAEIAQAGISMRLDDAMDRLQTERLDSIDRALEAMAGGIYGLCAACGGPIGVGRLRARPDTATCSSCEREAQGAA